jgi:hypothetical protein
VTNDTMDEVRADETDTTGDQHSHESTIARDTGFEQFNCSVTHYDQKQRSPAPT